MQIDVVTVPIPLEVEETQEYTKVTSRFFSQLEAVESTRELAIQSFKRALSFHFLVNI